MNCRRIQSLMSAYVDSELPGVEMLAVRQHVNNCEDCRSEFEATLHIKRTFGQLNSQTPRPALAADICARINVQAPHRHLSFPNLLQMRFPVSLRLAGMAAAASIAILGVVITHTGDGTERYIYNPLSSTVAVTPVALQDAAHLFAIPGTHSASFDASRDTEPSPNSWTTFETIPYSLKADTAAFWSTSQ